MSNPRTLLGDLSFRGGVLLGGYVGKLNKMTRHGILVPCRAVLLNDFEGDFLELIFTEPGYFGERIYHK